MSTEAVEELQTLLWLALHDQHTRQSERTRLVLIAGSGVVCANPLFAPARCSLNLSLREPASCLGDLHNAEQVLVALSLCLCQCLPEQDRSRLVFPAYLPDLCQNNKGLTQ